MKTSLETMASSLPPDLGQKIWGTLVAARGEIIHVKGLGGIAHLGDLVTIEEGNGHWVTGEVISLSEADIIVMVYGSAKGLRLGAKVQHRGQPLPRPCDGWIGQTLDPYGKRTDGKTTEQGTTPVPLEAKPPNPIYRKAIGKRLDTQLAAFDTFLPLCQGQRLGLFAGSGVGKSTLLADMAKGVQADIVVLALIGERGREVRSFIDTTLGPAGMKRTVVIAATSNDPAPLKRRAAWLALATAEFFRDQGKQVLLLFDSITRFAEAHREVALNAGETPSLRAFPPSTFRAIAELAERAGPGAQGKGDITALFSVLVAGSNMDEPVADMVRGILDGHIVLEREIAERGRYPAINIRRSVSRSLPEAATSKENHYLQQARQILSLYEDAAPMIRAGLYVPGSDALLDDAIKLWPALDQFISEHDMPSTQSSFEALSQILATASPPEGQALTVRKDQVDLGRGTEAVAL